MVYFCLYCGQPKEEKWDEMHKYYECDCPDAKKKREIEKQIHDLMLILPDEKYKLVKTETVVKIKE